ncbi:MAG: family 16 glycosylhydrolase [Bdellovibrionales bacterium]|nr:family 16 glycosylhydrolase [Bdellovibrionales bacterium]
MTLIIFLFTFNLFASELIFEENFNGPLDPQIWNIDNPDLIEFSPDGNIILKNEYNPYLKETRGARIHTKSKFEFKYGLIEIKVQIDSMKHLRPQVQLKATESAPSIDIEIYNQERKRYRATNAIKWTRNNRVLKEIRFKKTNKLVRNLQNTYYFSLEWKPYELIFSIDGIEVWRKFVQVKYMKNAYIDLYAFIDKSLKTSISEQWAIDFIKVYKKI